MKKDVSTFERAVAAGVETRWQQVAVSSEEVILRRVRRGGVVSFVPLHKFLSIGVSTAHPDEWTAGIWDIIWARYDWCVEWIRNGGYDFARFPWWVPQ